MWDRAGDLAARALLPALLLVLALLQLPLSKHLSGMTCHRISVMRLMRHVGELTPELEELLQAVTVWDGASAVRFHRYSNYLWALTCVFALGYLWVARERLAARVAVCAFATFAPVAFAAFGNIC